MKAALDLLKAFALQLPAALVLTFVSSYALGFGTLGRWSFLPGLLIVVLPLILALAMLAKVPPIAAAAVPVALWVAIWMLSSWNPPAQFHLFAAASPFLAFAMATAWRRGHG